MTSWRSRSWQPVVVLFASLALVAVACSGGVEPTTSTPAGETTDTTQSGTDTTQGGTVSPSSTSVSEATLQICMIGIMSGPAAFWGTALQSALETAIEDSGELVIGDTRYTIEPIIYDDEYSAQKAVDAANRLITRDEVKFIVGPIGSDSVLAVQPLIEEQGIFLLADSLSPDVVNPDAPLTFRMNLSTLEYSGGFYQWVAENLTEVESVVLIGPNDAAGQGVSEPGAEGASAAGLDAHLEYYERGTQDFTSLAARVMSLAPDAVDLAGSAPGDAATLAFQLRQAGFEGRFFKTGGSSLAQILDQLGEEATKGFVFFSDVDFSADQVASYADRIESEYGVGLVSLTPWWHDSIMWLIEAMRSSQSLDPDTVAQELRNMATFEGPLVGPLHWGGQDTYGINQQLIGPFFVMEWTGSESVVRAQLVANG